MVPKTTRGPHVRNAPARPMLSAQWPRGGGAGPCVRAHLEAGQSPPLGAPPLRDAARGLRSRFLAVQGFPPVTGSEMASNSGDRGTACTVRVEASCGILAGQRASAPRGVTVNL